MPKKDDPYKIPDNGNFEDDEFYDEEDEDLDEEEAEIPN